MLNAYSSGLSKLFLMVSPLFWSDKMFLNMQSAKYFCILGLQPGFNLTSIAIIELFSFIPNLSIISSPNEEIWFPDKSIIFKY